MDVIQLTFVRTLPGTKIGSGNEAYVTEEGDYQIQVVIEERADDEQVRVTTLTAFGELPVEVLELIDILNFGGCDD